MKPVVRFAIPSIGVLAILTFNAGLSFLPVKVSPIVARLDSQTNTLKQGVVMDVARATITTTETYSRPLFDPRRREPAPAMVEEPAVVTPPPIEPKKTVVETPPPDINLIGVSLANSGARALIRQGEMADWYGMDADVGGWQLKEISSSSISLTNGDRKVIFELYADVRANVP